MLPYRQFYFLLDPMQLVSVSVVKKEQRPRIILQQMIITVLFIVKASIINFIPISVILLFLNFNVRSA